ncbi:hypothetical protein OV203_16475 [Nannocystis sp. ILAH1]|uniref:hypothetical protein n=1 Tax=Nannocystis sp. ILAH1 TaxID=2996789 RepID=UPI00226F08CC|nr:hypothetical protein [Nannocystis sp. ILAH1]MCY0988732.1 hypothetical protein [Nannocystis sp. ILAH1]
MRSTSRKVAASGQGLRDLSTKAASILYRRVMAIDARRSRWVALGLTWAAACGEVGAPNESETVDATTDPTAGTTTGGASDTADAPTTGSTSVPGTTDADETTSTTGPVATDTGPTSTGTTDTGEPPPVPVGTIAELLVPFDVNQEDLVGPTSWEPQYGKSPEIVAVPLGATIDVLVQDYAQGPDGHAYVLRLEPSADDYVITAVLEPQMLDKVMGLARDPDGQLYVASGVAEGDTLTLDDPQPGQHRGGIVRVVKQSWDGAVQFDTDVDLGREAVAPDSEPIINPMVAGTARLAWGAGALALVHGNNTDTDWNIMARHQKALTTHLDAGSGTVTRTSSIWVSHSFDHRLFHDGLGFLELHLGDAFPRDVTFARVEPDSDPYSLLGIKGNTGNNNTFTRLGNAAPIEGDPTYGYLALFATESTTGTGDLVSGSRELALVRVRRDFETVPADSGMHLDPALPDIFDVESGGEPRQNRLRWLTHYQSENGGTTHAERPKLVPLGDDTYAVLWERWDGAQPAFAGTWGMVIDAAGEALVPAALIADTHLPRGDDAFPLAGNAAWITGDAAARQLDIHIVDAQLGYRHVVVE